MKFRFMAMLVAAIMTAGMMVTPSFAIDDTSAEAAALSEIENMDQGDQAEQQQSETEESEADEPEAVEPEAVDPKPEKKTISKQAVVAPNAVKGVDAKPIKGKGRYIIKWKKSKNADGYYVFVSPKKNKGFKKIKTVKGKKNTKIIYKNRKLTKHKKYYYKVHAYKKHKKKIIVSKTSNKDAAKNTMSFKRSFRVKATAYSGGGRCANGKRCRVGRIAVDPRVIPLGTWLYVKGYGICQACDTGGAIKGKKIDLYFNSEKKCNRYGVRRTKVYILR